MKRFFQIFALAMLVVQCKATQSSGGKPPTPPILMESDVERMKTMLGTLASDAMNGRCVGSAESTRAQEFLVDTLKQLKTKPMAADDTYLQPFVLQTSPRVCRNTELAGKNIIAIAENQTGNKTNQPVVLLSTHYDHVQHCTIRSEGTKCNGAADSAAGVVVILDVLRRIQSQIRQPVGITLWDAEEQGLLGSAYAVANQFPFDTSKIKLIVNLDVVGLNLFRGHENQTYILGSETGGAALTQNILELGSKTAIHFTPLSYVFGFGRSDLHSLLRLQKPSVFFTDGDGSVYHSTADRPEFINYNKLKAISDVVTGLVLTATNSDQNFTYAPPQMQPTQDDAKVAVALVDKLKAIEQTPTKNDIELPDVVASDLENNPALTGKIFTELMQKSRSLSFVP